MESVLDEKFNLIDLIDPGVLQEICEAYSKCFSVGVYVVSREGEPLVTVSEKTLLSGNDGRMNHSCDDMRCKLHTSPPELNSVMQTKSYCGMRFALFPLEYEFEAMGRAILGPFRSSEKDGGQISEKARKEIKENRLEEEDVLRLPIIEQSRLKAMINLLSRVIDGILFINAKRLITTRMHMDTLFESRDKIFREVERQDSPTKEDKEEIETLKNMF